MRGKFKRILGFFLCVVLLSTQTGLQPVRAAMEETVIVQEDTEIEIVQEEDADDVDCRIVSDTEGMEQSVSSQEIPMEERFIVNPLYKDVLDESELERRLHSAREEEPVGSAQQAYDTPDTVYNTVEEAASYLRSQMLLREKEVQFHVSQSLFRQEGENAGGKGSIIFSAAVEDTEACSGVEGDALRWVCAGYMLGGSSNGTVFTLSFNIEYYTNYEQEQQLTEAVERAMGEMQLEGKPEREKVCIIHDYICDHVDYDYENLNNPSYMTKFTAYAALCNGKAVCQGYAVLFYRMCKEAGLSVRVISGKGNGQNHAWNIVRVGEYYYNVDCTWDGQDAETRQDWLLVEDADFTDHVRDAEYASAEFYEKYPMTSDSENDTNVKNQYSSDQTAYIPDYPVSGYPYTGKAQKPKVVVLDRQGNELLLNADYTVKYKKNVNVGEANLTIKGKGRKKAEVGVKTISFTIRPAALSRNFEILPIKARVYAAKEQKPSVKVRMIMANGKKKTLKAKKDYTLSYLQNEDSGTASVIITGKGNYKGSMSTAFEIKRKPVSKGIKVSKIMTQTYDGNAKCPKPSIVRFKTKTLEEGRDYTLSYQNNTEIGKAQIIITGMGNYEGTLRKYFKIK